MDCGIMKNFVVQRKRMCAKHTYPSGKQECKKCPLGKLHGRNCSTRECAFANIEQYEKALAIVQKWSDNNLVETRKSKFLKLFPKASLEDSGIPTVCAGDVFGFRCEYKGEPDVNCKFCWSQEYVEV